MRTVPGKTDHVVVVVNPTCHALVKKSLAPFVKQRYLIGATWIIHIAPIFCLLYLLCLYRPIPSRRRDPKGMDIVSQILQHRRLIRTHVRSLSAPMALFRNCM